MLNGPVSSASSLVRALGPTLAGTCWSVSVNSRSNSSVKTFKAVRVLIYFEMHSLLIEGKFLLLPILGFIQLLTSILMPETKPKKR